MAPGRARRSRIVDWLGVVVWRDRVWNHDKLLALANCVHADRHCDRRSCSVSAAFECSPHRGYRGRGFRSVGRWRRLQGWKPRVPPFVVEGIDEIRAGPSAIRSLACTDELGCLMLVGRIDRWLALDDGAVWSVVARETGSSRSTSSRGPARATSTSAPAPPAASHPAVTRRTSSATRNATATPRG